MIKSGVGTPSYATLATWAQVTGAWDSDYPITNLANLRSIRSVAKASGSGVRAFTFILPAAVSLQFLAMLDHNGAAASTVRYRLFSDNNPDPVGNAGAIVHDSGTLSLLPGGANADWPQNHPYVLSAAVTARSCRIDLSSHATAWQIGAFEIAAWWEWTDVETPREFGLNNNDVVAAMPNGITHEMSQWAPRVIKGTRGVVTQTEIHTTALDFQLATGLRNPFVWVWDFNDSTTWPREVVLVHNASLPSPRAVEYPGGRFAFDFEEWLR